MIPLRNFSIISHIDHGKTTLTDRLLELSGIKLAHQRLLDAHPIEQEKGITIKLAPVRLRYPLPEELQKTYSSESTIFNLIDTPGHIDFTYEVSRSLAACEGALLLVDALAGIQAQTASNFNKALEEDLVIIPMINKVDLKEANPEKVAQEVQKAFGFQRKEILFISAKTGEGVKELIPEIIKKIPAPIGKPDQPLQALIFNLTYHPHFGLVLFVKVANGTLQAGETLRFINQKTSFKVQRVGYFKPEMQEAEKLSNGEVGFIATGLKDYSFCPIGDTLTTLNAKVKAFPGYQPIKPVVFAQIFPLKNQDFPKLHEAIRKLKLNDSALDFQVTSSATLGKGLQVGFLGLLHAQITQERLEQDYGLELIITQPTVTYKILLKSGEEQLAKTAQEFPEANNIKEVKEPFIEATIFTPIEYSSQIIKLSYYYRAKLLEQKYYGDKVQFLYLMPLSEFISGFFDELKSCSSGFASLDWQAVGFKKAQVVKLDVLINREKITALSRIVSEKKVPRMAQKLADTLKAVIPKQQFSVPVQIAVGGKIIARADLKAYRKDVTAKLYGGDQTRKDKLLKKQKKGKKRLKRLGQVSLPQEAFWKIVSS